MADQTYADLALWAQLYAGDGPLPRLTAVACNCATFAPTMPVFREEHFVTCPMSLVAILAREARSYRELLPRYQTAIISATIHERVCRGRPAPAGQGVSSEDTNDG